MGTDRARLLKEAYSLQRHPEGGWFREVYTCPARTEDGRPLMGSIYFLLDGGEISHLHVIDCDELWFYHEGCGMKLTLIDPSGNVSFETLGGAPDKGQAAMVTIGKGTWFAAENLDPAGCTFVSCPTAPRFRYEGFRLVTREELRAFAPAWAEKLDYLIL